MQACLERLTLACQNESASRAKSTVTITVSTSRTLLSRAAMAWLVDPAAALVAYGSAGIALIVFGIFRVGELLLVESLIAYQIYFGEFRERTLLCCSPPINTFKALPKYW